MAYGIKYNFNFSNELDEVYYLTFEFLDYTGGQQNINVSVNAFSLRSTNGDEDKLFPILGTECLINILVGRTIDNKGIETDDSTLTVFDLIAAHDNDIRVTIVKVQPNYLQPVYQGFVVVEDNVQPFQDPPFILQIRALDGLGLLKNVDMTDTSGDLFAGWLSIEDWIGNILMKTGLVMNLRTYFPFYPIGVSGDGVNPLQQVGLNAITWQQGELTTTTDPSVDVFASEADDAYTALEKICRCFRSRLFQHDGVWNLVSLYTYVDPNGWSYFESVSTLNGAIYNQIPVAVSNGLNLTIPVGKEDIIHPVENDQQISLKLATKWIKLNYTYDQSVNKICNQNFKFGNPDVANDGTISSTIEDPSILPAVTFDYKAYDAFCWTLAGGTQFTNLGVTGTTWFPETPATAEGYIRNVLDVNGYQENRYLVINSSTYTQHFRSGIFKIDVNDRIEVSFDFRTNTGMGHVTIAPMVICFDGDDGSKWCLGGISSDPLSFKWWPVTTDYYFGATAGNTFSPFVSKIWSGSDGDETQFWSNIAIPTKDTNGVYFNTPVSGNCFIILQGISAGGASEAWFKNIQITIHPFIQGSYIQVDGDFNFSSSAETIKQTKTEDVEISDSPKRYFKGALVQSNLELVDPIWHRKGVLEAQRFQQLMERVIFNNLYRQYQKIEGSFRGHTYTLEDFTVKPSGYLNAYTFTQHPVPTKRFILTSFDRDYGKGLGRHVFVEILLDQNADPFINPETYLFQYIYT
jgi:hypothetical protein